MSFETELAAIKPAIKILLLFTRATRGSAIRRREINKIIVFVRDNASLLDDDTEKLAAWINRCPCWDEQDNAQVYFETLGSVPEELLRKCKFTARWIAQGSGRQPIAPQINEWIDSGFIDHPAQFRHQLFPNDQ